MVRPIVRSIRRTSAILFAVQAAGGVSIALLFDVGTGARLWYVVGLFLTHLALATVLSNLEDLFVTVPDRVQLDRVNLANLLSMIRISSTPTLVLLIFLLQTEDVSGILVPFGSLVFITDLFDGLISRRTGTITRIGRFLDSSSDYLILIVISIALAMYTPLHGWFFIVLGCRFGLQIAGQVVLFLRKRGRVEFRSSFLGKASVFATMALYALAFLGLAGMPPWYSVLMLVAEILVAALLVVSLVEKVKVFAVDVRAL